MVKDLITVGLPVYRQRRVLRAALEGLCLQKGSGEWELVISSEHDLKSIIGKYEKRLAKAGCKRVVYDKIDKWIPLPKKWRRIGRLMDENSLGMLLQAADCYPHRYRIRQSKKAMLQGYDWYDELRGYFYDIPSKTMVLFDGSVSRYKRPTNLNMCIAGQYARRLPGSSKKRGVDKWMFKTIPDPKVFVYKSVPLGVDFVGFNNISVKRSKAIQNLEVPFVRTSTRINDIINDKLCMILGI